MSEQLVCPTIESPCLGTRCMKWYACIRQMYQDYYAMHTDSEMPEGVKSPDEFRQEMERLVEVQP